MTETKDDRRKIERFRELAHENITIYRRLLLGDWERLPHIVDNLAQLLDEAYYRIDRLERRLEGLGETQELDYHFPPIYNEAQERYAALARRLNKERGK